LQLDGKVRIQFLYNVFLLVRVLFLVSELSNSHKCDFCSIAKAWHFTGRITVSEIHCVHIYRQESLGPCYDMV